jgi:hypothetical protein
MSSYWPLLFLFRIAGPSFVLCRIEEQRDHSQYCLQDYSLGGISYRDHGMYPGVWLLA